MRETGYKKIPIPADGYCCYHSMLFITLAMLHGKDYLITSINTHKENIFRLLESYNEATPETNAQKQILQEILNEHIPFPSLYERLSDSLLGNSRTEPVEVIESNIGILENSSQSIEGISSSTLLNGMLSTESKDFNHAQLQSLSHEILQNFLSGKTTAGDLGEHYPKIFHHFIRALASIELNYASHSDMESNAETAFKTYSKNEGFTALRTNGWGTTADIERFKYGLFGTEGVEDDPCHIYGIQFDNRLGIHYDLILPYAYDLPSDLLVSTVSPGEGLDQRYATALQILENLENTDSRSFPSIFQPPSNRALPSTSSEHRPLRYTTKSTPMLAQQDTNIQKLAASLTT